MIKIQSNIYGLFLGVLLLIALFSGGVNLNMFLILAVLIFSNFKYQITINQEKED
jgi:hypothetical protein